MKLLTGQDLLTMIIKGQDLSNIWVGEFNMDDEKAKSINPNFTMFHAAEHLLLAGVLNPNLIILDISK